MLPINVGDITGGYFMLGRTYLQGVFLGVDFERNFTYIAQAPGPNLQQVITTTVPSGGVDIVPSAVANSFVGSWTSTWTIFDTKSPETPSPHKHNEAC
jgi:hypothetical protein